MMMTGSIGEWAAPIGSGRGLDGGAAARRPGRWRNENSVGSLAQLTQVVNAYEAVNAEFGISDLRWMVHHVPFVTTELLDRLQRLGVRRADAAFTWITGTPSDIGAQFRPILDHPIKAGIHGDGVHIAPLNPWGHIYYATTGVNAFGVQINGASRSPGRRPFAPSRARTPGSCAWRTRSARSRPASWPTSSCWTRTSSPCTDEELKKIKPVPDGRRRKDRLPRRSAQRRGAEEGGEHRGRRTGRPRRDVGDHGGAGRPLAKGLPRQRRGGGSRRGPRRDEGLRDAEPRREQRRRRGRRPRRRRARPLTTGRSTRWMAEDRVFSAVVIKNGPRSPSWATWTGSSAARTSSTSRDGP